MPITRQLTAEELQKIAEAGGNPLDYQGKLFDINTPEEDAAIDAQENAISKGATVGRTLKAHGGGMAGGGVGTIGGMAAGAELGLLGGPAAPVTVPVGTLIGGLIGGYGGGYVGQKAQDTILGEKTTEELRKSYEEAEAQHPFVAGATDLVGNMVAGGMKPSLSNIPKAVRGLVTMKGAEMTAEELATLAANRKALVKVAGGAILNPAISTGISVAQGHGIPSIGELAREATGGALFSEQTKWGARLTGHGGQVQEPSIEPTEKTVGGEVPEGGSRTDGEVVPTKEVVEPIIEKAKPITEAGETAEDLQKQLDEELQQAPKKDYQLTPKDSSFVQAPAILTQGLLTGKMTREQGLSVIASDRANPFAPLAESILAVAPKEKLQGVARVMTKEFQEANPEVRSHYINDKVVIHPEDVDDAHAFMHEVLHATQDEIIPNFKGEGVEYRKSLDQYLASPDGHEGVKELIRSFYEYTKHLDMDEHLYGKNGKAGNPEGAQALGETLPEGGKILYSMSNLKEFDAMANTNKEVQEYLNALPSGLNDGKSLWSRIVDAIRSILGVPVKQGSLLERALRASESVMKTERPSSKLEREAGGLLQAPAKDINERDTTRQSLIKGWAATFDKVRAKSIGLAEAFQKERATRDSIQALGTTALVDLQKLPHDIVTKVFADHRANWREGVPLPKYTGTAKQASDILNRYYVQEIGKLKQEGPKIGDRTAHITPNYVNDSMNDKWVDIFTKDPTSKEAQHGIRAWADYVVRESDGRITKAEALENINNYVEAMGGERNNYRTLEFGAVRKAAGFGLPEGMRETDPIKAIAKYSPRVAADLAFFKEIQNRPEISGSLKIKDENGILHTDDPRANPSLAADRDIKDAMRWITGNYGSAIGKNSPHLAALSRAYNNSIMGPATGIRNTLQVPVMAIPYIHDMGSLKAFFTGAMKFRQEARAALESGARIPQIDKIQFDVIKDSPDVVVTALNKFATLARKWQGREALENFDRNVTFAAGKELAKYNIIGALKGNKNSVKFLEKFGLNVEGDVTKLAGADLEKALNQMAKNFVDRNQGTYSGAGLALGVVDSPLAPFLALQKWSIEKQNVIFQDVVKPFLSGENHLPLITYTLGSALTGAVIQEINKVLTGRKAQDPELKEALGYRDKNGNVSPVAVVSELATLMQLASFSGLVGDALKATSDVALHGKTPRNIVSYPVLSGAMDVGTKTTDMMEALRQGEDPWVVWKEYATDLLTHNIQAIKMLSNYTIDKDNLERSDKFRDVRVYNELEGKPAKDFPTTNPYLGLENKTFKREEDPSKAIAMLPALLKKALADAKGDPFVLKQKLQALKANNYQIMPSMENTPLSFMRYLNYLKATQGEEAAQERLQEYVRQNMINKVKSSVVPSLR